MPTTAPQNWKCPIENIRPYMVSGYDFYRQEAKLADNSSVGNQDGKITHAEVDRWEAAGTTIGDDRSYNSQRLHEEIDKAYNKSGIRTLFESTVGRAVYSFFAWAMANRDQPF